MLPKQSAFRPFVLAALLLTLVMMGTQTAAAQQEQIVGSTDGAISVHVPAGWVATNIASGPVFSSLVIFAQDQTVLDTAVRSLTGAVPSAIAPGVYGVVSILSPQAWTMLSGDPQQALLAYLNAITQSNSYIPDSAVKINNVFQANIGGVNGIVYDISTSPKVNTRAYVGGFVANNSIALFQLGVSPASNFDTNAQLLQAISASIRVPAEPGALDASVLGSTPTPLPLQNLPTLPPANGLPTLPPAPEQPTLEQPTQVAVQPTVAPPAGEASPVPQPLPVSLQRSAGDRLSLELPDGWVFLDRSADLNAVAYGDSQAAAQSRLDTVFPPPAGTAPTPITGIGGVVVLYKMSDFGVDPNAPDLKPLLDGLIGNLTKNGYQVIVQPETFDLGGAPGMIVVVSGGEYGFIELIAFGDQIAYVTGTTPPNGMVGNAPLANQMFALVQSVRVPAAQPPTPTPNTPPVGGLGGLQPPATEGATGGLGGLTVPAAQPTPTQAGLGGLALPPATP